MYKRWFSSLLLLMMCAAALMGQSREAVLKAIQQDSKWSPADQPAQYDEKNIAKLSGKRAEAIQHYGLTGATTQTWMGPDGPVRLTLYEMLDAGAAYGVFTLDRNLDEAGFAAIPIGTEGFRVGNHAEFWQAKYVVRLEGSTAATDKLARAISANVFGSSHRPQVATHLPPENLIQGSEKYIIDASALGRNLDLDPQTLGFDDSVDVATADYRVNGKIAHLVLLMYPNQQLAKKYEDQWLARSPADAGLRKRVSALFAIVRGSKDPNVAKAILDGVNYETQVTWDQPRPDISMRDVILTIFSFIGIALLFTLVVGLSYGGVRIFVKWRYPNRVFDRPQDMEIIQLKLGQGVTPKQLIE
ncbi:MAG TPA: DUF6599 family protein [Terriglobia bacterium]